MTAMQSIDVAPLFGAELLARVATDESIYRSAGELGFLTIRGLPVQVPVGRAAQTSLFRVFDLDAADRRRLWRQKFEPANPNLYRGWFPVQPGNLTAKEGMDIGGDLAYGAAVLDPDDPLCEPTPLPPEALLPGWRSAVARYYVAMENVCRVLMQSVARSLGLSPEYFDEAFRHGLSTLRLLRYPVRGAAEPALPHDSGLWIERGENRRSVIGAPHTDSGFITLLAQDGVPGLQARARDGRWMDIPPHEDVLVVNFGQVLERWSGGRIRATEHRVLGAELERRSIPFFYEARAAAEVRPLPIDDPRAFDAFLYGDFLWERMVKFVEFRDMKNLRTPRGPATRAP